MGDLLAAAAGLLQAGGLDQLQPGRDQFEDLADVFTDQAQGAAAVGAVVARVEHDALARRAFGHQGLAAARRGGRCGLLFIAEFGVVIRRNHADCCRPGYLEMFQRQFELFDLSLDAFRAGPELLLLQPRDLDLQRLNQCLMRAQRGRQLRDIRVHPGTLGLQSQDHRLQSDWIIGDGFWENRAWQFIP